MKKSITLLSLFLFFSCTHQHHHSNINEKYLDPQCNAEEWNKAFENKEKDTILFQKQILERLPLKKGATVADVGAGTGVFEAPLSRMVGDDGKIFAVDLAPAFIPFMKERFKKEGLKNVEVILGKIDTTTLMENSVDLILVVDTYHHFDHPELMLADFKKILRDNGYLVVIDFKRDRKARQWILDHVEKDEEQYIREISRNGFIFLRRENIPFKESFQLTFKK
jgi:ubiquinone/menaquinone biosynthesis C-methylase UbiE